MSEKVLFSKSGSGIKSPRFLVKCILLFCLCFIAAFSSALPEQSNSAEQKGLRVEKVESGFMGKFKSFFFEESGPDEIDKIPFVREVTWRDLFELDLKTNQPSWGLQKQLSSDVSIKGFIIPLDYDTQQRINEFLLVPYIPSCMHVPPPPANQMVHVKLREGKRMKDIFYPVEAIGDLIISKTKLMDDRLTSSYAMDVRSLKVLSDSGMDPFKDFFGNTIH